MTLSQLLLGHIGSPQIGLHTTTRPEYMSKRSKKCPKRPGSQLWAAIRNWSLAVSFISQRAASESDPTPQAKKPRKKERWTIPFVRIMRALWVALRARVT